MNKADFEQKSDNYITNKKQELRKAVLAVRSSLDRGRVKELSEIICARVEGLPLYRLSEDVCLYVPIRNEVDVLPLIEFSHHIGKRVWLPKTTGDDMEFYRYDKSTPLEAGRFHILEPVSDSVLVPNDKTLIIMPGAVFSESNERIGYGGGYYDRYLGKYPMCRRIAVCYNFQILSHIPADRHDIKPELVISEG